MSHRMGAIGLIGCIAAVACVQCFAALTSEPPKVFTKLTWAEAKKEAAEPRLVLLDFTASWCAPCKQMEATSWRDERVEKWIADNKVIAVQVDVEKDRATAEEFHATALPLLVLVRGETTVGRSAGFKNADQTLGWLEGAAGPTAAPEPAAQPRPSLDLTDLKARQEHARAMFQEGKFEQATEECLLLFEQTANAKGDVQNLRRCYVLPDIHRLCTEYAEARARFAVKRDEIEAVLKGAQGSWDDLYDWLVLNEALRDTDRTIAWFDRIKDEPDAKQTLRRNQTWIESGLIARGRWADIARFTPSARLRARQEMGMLRMGDRLFTEGDQRTREQMRQTHEMMCRDSISTMYAALLAASREEDAVIVEREVLTVSDGGLMRWALIEKAVRANECRPRHLGWLGLIKVEGFDGAAVRARIEQSIKAQARQG